MSTVRELLAGLVMDVSGDFGIEIECEGKGIKEVNSKYWKTVPDGSLRGEYLESCAEYVSKLRILPDGRFQALIRTKHRVHPSLRSLFTFHLGKAIFDKSPRTSTHVHVNVLDLTRKELFNYVYLLTLLEDILLKLSGKSRLGNRFCLSSKEACGYFQGVACLFKETNTRFRLSAEEFKYSAINLATVAKYGTVEIRSMEGTDDAVRLTRWINLLLSIKDLAKQYTNAYHIMEDLERFKESKIQSLIKEFPELLGTDIENNILYSLSYCCEFPEYYEEIQDRKVGMKIGDFSFAVGAAERPGGGHRFFFDEIVAAARALDVPPRRRPIIPAPVEINDEFL